MVRLERSRWDGALLRLLRKQSMDAGMLEARVYQEDRKKAEAGAPAPAPDLFAALPKKKAE
jgi:hypothetical protein